MFRLEQLEHIAREKVKTLNFVDEIESYLAYQVKLREPLLLTCVSPEMRYFGAAYVTSDDLKFAEATVKRQENEAFAAWLSQWLPWKGVLSRVEPVRSEAAQAQRNEMLPTYDAQVEANLKADGLQHDADARVAVGKQVMDTMMQDIDMTLTHDVLEARSLLPLLNTQWPTEIARKRQE